MDAKRTAEDSTKTVPLLKLREKVLREEIAFLSSLSAAQEEMQEVVAALATESGRRRADGIPMRK